MAKKQPKHVALLTTKYCHFFVIFVVFLNGQLKYWTGYDSTTQLTKPKFLVSLIPDPTAFLTNLSEVHYWWPILQIDSILQIHSKSLRVIIGITQIHGVQEWKVQISSVTSAATQPRVWAIVLVGYINMINEPTDSSNRQLSDKILAHIRGPSPRAYCAYI